MSSAKQDLDLLKQLAQCKDSTETWRKQAENLLLQCAYSRAKLLLETLLENHPEDVEARLLLVRACLELKKVDEAVQYARHASKVAPTAESNGALNARCAVALAVALGHHARLPQFAEKERHDIRQESTQLLVPLATNPPDATPLAVLATAQYCLAVQLAELGQQDEAVSRARDALQAASQATDPGSSGLVTNCLVLLALLLSARQQFQTALTVLGAGSKYSATGGSDSAGSLEAQVLLARVKAKILMELGSDEAAVRSLVETRVKVAHAAAAAKTDAARASLTDQEWQVWQDLALACAYKGSHQDASKCVEQVLKVQPWAAASFTCLACVEQAAGNGVAALEHYTTALSLDAQHAAALMGLGVLYRRRGNAGDLGLAHNLLSEALRYQPSDPQGWYNLGLVCKALQQRKEAERHLYNAVLLANSAPIMSFSSLPLTLA